MTAKLMDGKATAATVRAEVAQAVATRVQKGLVRPGLVTVLVGEDPASQVYVRNKRKACDEVGFAGKSIPLPSTTTQTELLDLIAQLNADTSVHGILVQLPLPKQISEEAVLLAIHPNKDVDGFHPMNVGRLAAGLPVYYPCTPHGCVQLLQRYGHETRGKHAVIVGRSNIVGKPLAMMLMQKPTALHPAGGDCTVTVAHTRTNNLKAMCLQADILVAAVGVPRLITPDMVKPGAVVLDVGINRVGDRIVGDAHEDCATVAGAITPVPGGVGPMTIAMLLVNTLKAAPGYEP